VIALRAVGAARLIGAALLSAAWCTALGGCFGSSEPARSEYFVVSFETGTARPTADGKRALAAAAAAARRSSVSRIVVQSGATPQGKARADAARAALTESGTSADKITEAMLENSGDADGSDVTIQVLIGPRPKQGTGS
jgi:hypothetical protein